MSVYQRNSQFNSEGAMILGSAQIEFSTDQGQNWEPIGLVRSLSIKFAGNPIEVKADNGVVPLHGVMGRSATVDFRMLERSLPLLNHVSSGIHIFETEVGAEATVTQALENVKANTFYLFKQYNADGTQPINITINSSARTKAVIDASAYTVVQSGAYWGMTFKADHNNLTVQYKITPPQSYTLKGTASGFQNPISMRVVNSYKNPSGASKRRTFEFYYGFLNYQDEVTFKTREDADPVAEVPMSFVFTPDPADENRFYVEKQEL